MRFYIHIGRFFFLVTTNLTLIENKTKEPNAVCSVAHPFCTFVTFSYSYLTVAFRNGVDGGRFSMSVLWYEWNRRLI